jgi:hypothetical protein
MKLMNEALCGMESAFLESDSHAPLVRISKSFSSQRHDTLKQLR